MRDRIEQLIWESQDGEITPADREWLSARLAQDPAARAAAEAAANLAPKLEEIVREVDPPPELRWRIQAALASARREPRRRSIFGTVRALLLPPGTPRFAYLTAGLIGLVLGGAGAYLFSAARQQGPIPLQELYGTMRPLAAGGVELKLAGGAGALTLRRHGLVLEVEADLPVHSADEIRIRAAALRIVRFEAQPGGAARLGASAQEIFARELGSGHHLLILEVVDAGTAIEITVSARGQPLLQRELRLSEL